MGDELLDRLADAGVGDFSAAFRLVSGGEKGAHFHETLRGEDVFPRHRARHGGRMEFEFVGDVVHRQRAQVAGAFFKKGGLLLDELVGDGEDGFLAQGNGSDQAAAVANLVAEEGAGFRIDAIFADHVLVEIVDAQAGQVLAGEPCAPSAIVVALDDDVGEDVGIAGGIELAAGVRGKATDVVCRLGDALDRGAQCAGDLRMAFPGQILQVVADNLVFEGFGAR